MPQHGAEPDPCAARAAAATGPPWMNVFDLALGTVEC